MKLIISMAARVIWSRPKTKGKGLSEALAGRGRGNGHPAREVPRWIGTTTPCTRFAKSRISLSFFFCNARYVCRSANSDLLAERILGYTTATPHAHLEFAFVIQFSRASLIIFVLLEAHSSGFGTPTRAQVGTSSTMRESEKWGCGT
jgi:hypothetical protein